MYVCMHLYVKLHVYVCHDVMYGVCIKCVHTAGLYAHIYMGTHIFIHIQYIFVATFIFIV
jgi:hypothetical protein